MCWLAFPWKIPAIILGSNPPGIQVKARVNGSSLTMMLGMQLLKKDAILGTPGTPGRKQCVGFT